MASSKSEYRVLPSVLQEKNARRLVLAALALVEADFAAGESLAGRKRFSPGQRLLVPLTTALGPIMNGGFDSFFRKIGGVEAMRAHLALVTIGATRAAGAFRDAMSTFPKGVPPADADRRKRVLDRYDDDALEQRFAPINQRFYQSIDRELYPRAAAFIRANREEFVRPVAGIAPKVLDRLRAALAGHLRDPDARAVARFAKLGAPAAALALFEHLNWKGGLIECEDAVLRDLRTLLELHRKGQGKIIHREGFVVVGQTVAEQNTYAVATARQSRKTVGSVWLFSSRRDLYRKGFSPASFAHAVAADFGQFLDRFAHGRLLTREFLQRPGSGGPDVRPVWRAGGLQAALRAAAKAEKDQEQAEGARVGRPRPGLAVVVGKAPLSVADAVAKVRKYLADHRLKMPGVPGEFYVDAVLEKALEEKVSASFWQIDELVEEQMVMGRVR